MKRLVIALAALSLLGTLAFAQAAAPAAPAAKSVRTDGDFVKIILQQGWGDKVDGSKKIVAAEMGDYYFFYPVLKAGKLVGYAWWTRDVRIASHYEDMLMLIGKDGTLESFWVDANSHHPDMISDKGKSRFYGMDYHRDFNDKVDTITGSTFSSYKYFGELKATLLAFKLYVIDAGLLK